MRPSTGKCYFFISSGCPSSVVVPESNNPSNEAILSITIGFPDSVFMCPLTQIRRGLSLDKQQEESRPKISSKINNTL